MELELDADEREPLPVLVGALAEPASRARAAARLARSVGASALLAWIPHPHLARLLPVPGLDAAPPTSPSWSRFLATCRAPGEFQGPADAPATAFVGADGLVLVFLGGASPGLRAGDLSLPLLGAVFRAQHAEAASLASIAHATTLAAQVDAMMTELDEALRNQRELLLERERLMGIVSHDLRNPLQAITLSAVRLLTHSDLSETQAKAVRGIHASVQRMTRLISQLVDLERSRLGAFPLKRTPLPLATTVAQAIEELEIAHPGRTLSFQSTGPGLGLWDEGRILQLSSNLLGNALEHSPEGTPVEVHLDDAAPHRVVLIIANRTLGPPLTAEAQAHLFDPFRRGEGSRGLGLGLFIVRQIAQAHGGTVSVASTAQETAFTVILPRSAEA